MTRRLRARARAHLNYATIVTAISVFLLLAGGAAYAASNLAKNSVGTKQLQKNSVTAAKIKKGAVTSAKIKKDAVTGAKFKAGGLTGPSFNLATTPYSRIVHVAKVAAPAAVGEDLAAIPVESGTYSQPAGEDDMYTGVATVSVPAECEGPDRTLYLVLSVDAKDPLKAKYRTGEVVSETSIDLTGSGAATVTASLDADEWVFAPSVPTSHTLSLTADVECEGGTQTGVVNSAEFIVVGTR
jgi:hypothetical protein